MYTCKWHIKKLTAFLCVILLLPPNVNARTLQASKLQISQIASEQACPDVWTVDNCAAYNLGVITKLHDQVSEFSWASCYQNSCTFAGDWTICADVNCPTCGTYKICAVDSEPVCLHNKGEYGFQNWAASGSQTYYKDTKVMVWNGYDPTNCANAR